MVAHPLGREWGKQRVSDWLRADTEAALGTLLDSTTEEEVHLLPQVVSRLKQPVYFVAGEKDTVMETKYVRHLASFHSLFQACADNVIEIPECGHMSMVEKPNAIAQEIKAIIQNNQS
jgi:pimeloyl-ACP methyl ester carboxylesterase